MSLLWDGSGIPSRDCQTLFDGGYLKLDWENIDQTLYLLSIATREQKLGNIKGAIIYPSVLISPPPGRLPRYYGGDDYVIDYGRGGGNRFYFPPTPEFLASVLVTLPNLVKLTFIGPMEDLSLFLLSRLLRALASSSPQAIKCLDLGFLHVEMVSDSGFPTLTQAIASHKGVTSIRIDAPRSVEKSKAFLQAIDSLPSLEEMQSFFYDSFPSLPLRDEPEKFSSLLSSICQKPNLKSLDITAKVLNSTMTDSTVLTAIAQSKSIKTLHFPAGSVLPVQHCENLADLIRNNNPALESLFYLMTTARAAHEVPIPSSLIDAMRQNTNLRYVCLFPIGDELLDQLIDVVKNHNYTLEYFASGDCYDDQEKDEKLRYYIAMNNLGRKKWKDLFTESTLLEKLETLSKIPAKPEDFLRNDNGKFFTSCISPTSCTSQPFPFTDEKKASFSTGFVYEFLHYNIDIFCGVEW